MKRHVTLALAFALLMTTISVPALAHSMKSTGGKAAGGASLGMADKMAAQAEKRRAVPRKASKSGGWAAGGAGGGWATNTTSKRR
jgi:uncharacterized membrane protein